VAEKPTAKQIANALRQQIFKMKPTGPLKETLVFVMETAIDHIEANAGLTAADVPWLPPGDHFVTVAERDSFVVPSYEWDAYGIPRPVGDRSMPIGPITWEHYLGESTTRDAIDGHIRGLGERYGRKAIAKLVFVMADL
jgi:hypothetical protein